MNTATIKLDDYLDLITTGNFLFGTYPMGLAIAAYKAGYGKTMPLYSEKKWRTLNPQVDIEAKDYGGFPINYSQNKLYEPRNLQQKNNKPLFKINSDVAEIKYIDKPGTKEEKYLNEQIYKLNQVRILKKHPKSLSEKNEIPSKINKINLIEKMFQYTKTSVSDLQHSVGKTVEPALNMIVKAYGLSDGVSQNSLEQKSNTVEEKNYRHGPQFMASDYPEPTLRFHNIKEE